MELIICLMFIISVFPFLFYLMLLINFKNSSVCLPSYLPSYLPTQLLLYAQWTKGECIINEFRLKMKIENPENFLCNFCEIYLQRIGYLQVTNKCILIIDRVIYLSLFVVCLFCWGFFLFVFVFVLFFSPLFLSLHLKLT